FVGLAKNNAGFRELNDFLASHLHSGKPIPDRAPQFENAWILYPYAAYTGWRLRPAELIGIGPGDIHRYAATTYHIPSAHLVISHPVTLLKPADHELHLLLRAIGENTLLSKINPAEGASE